MSRIITTEIFIKEAKGVHKKLYDYSLVDYKNNKIKVKIICLKHGIFEQLPPNHTTQKQGCPVCGGTKKLTTDEFIKISKTVHGDKYDYSLVNYINANTKVKIICPKHDVFEQSPGSHYSQKQGCPKCSGNKKLTTKEFVDRSKVVHGDKYDYSLVNYINANTKVKIICPIHSVFEQDTGHHINGHGCSKCVGRNKTSDEFIEISKKNS